MTAIPSTPVPLQGLIPLQGGRWPVVFRKAHPIFKWLYTIHQRSATNGLVIWCNFSQADILREMDQVTKYPVGSKVDLGPFNQATVLKRKWNFEKGTMSYLISGKRPGRDWQMDEEELTARIKAAEGG